VVKADGDCDDGDDNEGEVCLFSKIRLGDDVSVRDGGVFSMTETKVGCSK